MKKAEKMIGVAVLLSADAELIDFNLTRRSCAEAHSVKATVDSFAPDPADTGWEEDA